jgi:hypothetical protein
MLPADQTRGNGFRFPPYAGSAREALPFHQTMIHSSQDPFVRAEMINMEELAN